jgi:predicted dehydrogenase
VQAIHNWYNGVSKFRAQKRPDAIRIGVISAARINWAAFFLPADTHPGVVVAGVAARQLSSAQAQIKSCKLGPDCKPYGSYQAMLDDASIDAVYISGPNSMHAEWSIKALEAGKHVLIEKPIAANADEARAIRVAAEKSGKVALEAFHWRFHPSSHRVKQLVESGEYGKVLSYAANMNAPRNSFAQDDIRMRYDLAGG